MNHYWHPNRSRKSSRLLAVAVLWLVYQSPAEPAAIAPDEPQFRTQYEHQYNRIKSLKPDMVVETLRSHVELVASRGSQVGAASSDRRCIMKIDTELREDRQRVVREKFAAQLVARKRIAIDESHRTAAAGE